LWRASLLQAIREGVRAKLAQMNTKAFATGELPARAPFSPRPDPRTPLALF
jgi:hypothetical protein